MAKATKKSAVKKVISPKASTLASLKKEFKTQAADLTKQFNKQLKEAKDTAMAKAALVAKEAFAKHEQTKARAVKEATSQIDKVRAAKAKDLKSKIVTVKSAAKKSVKAVAKKAAKSVKIDKIEKVVIKKPKAKK